MLQSWRQERPGTTSQAYCCFWAIRAPWAHSVWSEYLLTLTDLRPLPGRQLNLYMSGATHEFSLYPLDPRLPLEDQQPLIGADNVRILTPANVGFQFIAIDNVMARDRLQDCVDAIAAQTLSPNDEARPVWAELFKGGFATVFSMPELMRERRRARLN